MYYIVDENNEIIDESKNSLKLRLTCSEMNQRFGGKCKVINEVEIEKPHTKNEMKKEFLVSFQAEETASFR